MGDCVAATTKDCTDWQASEVPSEFAVDCEHKTELVSVLMDAYKNKTGRTLSVTFQNSLEVGVGGSINCTRGRSLYFCHSNP